MRRQLIRAALLLYPAGWRRRYGSELEQLIFDCGADDASLAGSARILIELTGAGLAQRARSSAIGTRIAVVACACAAVGMAVDSTTLAQSTSNNFSVSSYDNISFAPHALLPARVTEIHAPSTDFPGTFEAQPQKVTVQFFRGSSRLIGISGPPQSIVIDTSTEKVLSVKAKAHG